MRKKGSHNETHFCKCHWNQLLGVRLIILIEFIYGDEGLCNSCRCTESSVGLDACDEFARHQGEEPHCHQLKPSPPQINPTSRSKIVPSLVHELFRTVSSSKEQSQLLCLPRAGKAFAKNFCFSQPCMFKVNVKLEMN